ncbi:hypothetical protein EMCG_09526 [[Emmonsia] crescens]|uniref:Uncharacterized protein n=1 Tax=[Emmonsia] crescens TaxID=73230 RepID=A0A0G2J9S5_9EURO|nr:hypothetical protein EMCG_09526 [Emmonsia crescens UAMH 3008]
MVNLSSGRTPDLTQNGPLPTPVTSRKAAPGEFEPVEEMIDESNELNNKYKDPAGGIDMIADLTDYLQRKGRTPAIAKILSEFSLTGSANYPMWKEEILLAARQSKTDDILNDRQESQLSAYSLWSVIEDNFAKRPAVRRTRLFQELIEITSKSKGSDRAFIERLIAIRADYIRVGYKVEDFMFFDRLLTGVSKG